MAVNGGKLSKVMAAPGETVFTRLNAAAVKKYLTVIAAFMIRGHSLFKIQIFF